MFTVTDSLTYETETDDVYQDLWKDKELFDNSDYPKNSPFFNEINKKVIGKMKDEAAGVPMRNFVVIAPMIVKFGTGIKLDVFYIMVTKTFVTSLLLRNYDVITCILADT